MSRENIPPSTSSQIINKKKRATSSNFNVPWTQDSFLTNKNDRQNEYQKHEFNQLNLNQLRSNHKLLSSRNNALQHGTY